MEETKSRGFCFYIRESRRRSLAALEWRWRSISQQFFDWAIFSKILSETDNTVYIGFCDQPPSEGSGSLNPKEVAKSSGFQLDITTRRSQNTGWWSLDHSLLDIATNTGRYLLHKRQNLRSLNTRSLFMYWRRSVKGFAVAKARLAA